MEEKMPAPPGYKMVKKRDYSGGNIRDAISACDDLESLEQLRQQVVLLARAGRVSPGTLKKIEKAGAAKFAELSERRIRIPKMRGLGGLRKSKGGIYLP